MLRDCERLFEYSVSKALHAHTDLAAQARLAPQGTRTVPEWISSTEAMEAPLDRLAIPRYHAGAETTCAGAPVAGSQMEHAIMSAAPRGAILSLRPSHLIPFSKIQARARKCEQNLHQGWELPVAGAAPQACYAPQKSRPCETPARTVKSEILNASYKTLMLLQRFR